ncbi:collagen binding domain-containing protein [Anaerococcus sp. Marseille-Q5996]|uniref:MSCRAMM family protein n=1 Tax=Anaerococcus sp. Marseille-Q5996 TaxID=2972769 RepID=UPI0021C59C9B|nr:SpaA isopeptide-forming pilin-related protein [Anaerococcus sp. Marseille-Q5996]
MLRKKKYSFMAGLLSIFMVLAAIFSPVSQAAETEKTGNSHLTIKIPRNGRDAEESSAPRELKVYKISDKNLTSDELVEKRLKFDAMTIAEIEDNLNLKGETLKSTVVDAHDIIELKGLTPGAYLLKETDESAESHEYRVTSSTTNIQEGIIDVQEVNVKVEQNKPLKLHKYGLVYEEKLDDDTNRTPLEGVEFKLINNASGEPVALTKTGEGTYAYQGREGDVTLVTNKEGNVIIENLPVGNYKFTETKALEGYVIDNPDTDSFDYTRKDGHEVSMDNKKGETKNVQVGLHKIDEETKESLAGVEFRLYLKSGDILTPVGKDENGQYDVGKQYSDVFKTDEDGKIAVEKLPALADSDEYVFIEVKGLEGYHLNKDNYYPVKNNEVLTVENYKNPTLNELKLNKVDSFTNEPIDKVGFELYRVRVVDNDDNTKKITEEKVVLAGSNGSYEFKENIVQSEEVHQLYTDEKGQIVVKNLPDGEYFFREKEPHKDYNLPENRGKESERLKRKNITYTMKNRPINPPGVNPPGSNIGKGSYNFIKVDDSKEAKRLAGATFALYKINDKGEQIPVEINGKKYTVKSGSNGEFKVENLPYGKYALRETAAPSGYIPEVKPIVFEISNKSATNEAIMIVNKPDTPKPPVVTPPGSTPPRSTTPPTRTTVPPTNTPRTYYVPKDTPGIPRGPLVKTGDIRILVFIAIGLVMILFGNHIVRKEEKTQIANAPSI